MKALSFLLLIGRLSPFACGVEALVQLASPINSSASALTVASSQSNTSLADDPPEGWHLLVEPAPAPRQALRQKDIYLCAIAALTQLAMQDWNSAVVPTVFSEPEFPSSLRVYINTITGIVTPVKDAVWSVTDTLSFYSENPRIGFVETVFSTYQDGIRILKGGWVSVDRPVLPAAPSLPGDGGGAVNLSSVESGSLGSSQGDTANISLVLPGAASPNLPLLRLNASTSPRTPFNITLPDPTSNKDLILSFNFARDNPVVLPKAVYLALAGFLDHVAPRPNSNRVVAEQVTDADEIASVLLERHATDRRGRGLFTYGQAKRLPRAVAAGLTHDALFVTGYLDVLNEGGDVLLATMTLGKGPRWQRPSVAGGDEMVDVA